MEISDKQGRAFVEKVPKFLANSHEVCIHINRRCSNRKESGAKSRGPMDETAEPKLPKGDTVLGARSPGGVAATTSKAASGYHYVTETGERTHTKWHRMNGTNTPTP